MNNVVLLIKSVFYVNNLKKNITNTTHTAHILQMIQYIWLTNQSIWSLSTTRESQFLFVNINLFFDKLPFLLVCFLWLFWFQFWGFFCLSLIWVLLVLVLFVPFCNYLLIGELVMIPDFSVRWSLKIN